MLIELKGAVRDESGDAESGEAKERSSEAKIEEGVGDSFVEPERFDEEAADS
jgi:hypothetical protein